MDYNDQELLEYVYENHEEAIEIIYKKYEPMIKSTARKLFGYCVSTGLEMNDLIQEGMIALNDAINSYKNNKDTSFYTFAKTCIQRRMISVITSSRRLKHKILNESISLDYTNDDGDNVSLGNLFSNSQDNPEEVLFNIEKEKELIYKAKDVLTDFEYQVFELKYNDFDYKEIAKLLDKTPKAIDNAIQRIKSKLAKIIKDIKND